MKCKYGSLWRKWDLHVHTPMSILNENYKLNSNYEEFLKSSLGEKDYNSLNNIDKKMYYFINKLFKEAINCEIAAIGITDYYFIDGYKYIRETLNNNNKLNLIFKKEIEEDTDFLKKVKSIKLFPNIEFRTSVIIEGSKLQIHVIFSDELECDEIETNFINRLELITPEPNNTYILTHENVEKIGSNAKNRGVGGNGSDLFVGIKSISVTLEEIKKLIEDTKFKNRAIIILAEEDQSRISWDGQAGLERAKYYQYSDAIFTSNSSTIKWCSSKDCQETIEKKLPYLWGSDAHEYDKMFSFVNNRFLWIKSDVTFRGLLYALYRFENRIFIGNEPEELKNFKARKYYTIKEIDILPNKEKVSKKWFDTTIKFNPFMTTIIGNKGSGKSAVSDIVAYLSNSHKISNASFLNRKRFLDKKTNYGNDFMATIKFYSDDRASITKEKLSDNFELSQPEHVKYLPQSYIEDICNNLGDKFQKEIDRTIFSYVSMKDKVDATTIQELSEIKTKTIDEEIHILQIELKNINEIIINLENKSTSIYRKQKINQLSLLKEKRENHIKQKPKEIIEPLDIENSYESNLILNLNEKIEYFKEERIKKIHDLERINQQLQKINNIQRDLQNILDISEQINQNYADFMSSIGRNNNEIVTITIKDNLLKNIFLELNEQQQQLNNLLGDNNLHNQINKEYDIDMIEEKLNEYISYSDKIRYLMMVVASLEDSISAEQQEYFVYKKELELWENYLLMLDGEIPNEIDNISIKSVEKELKYINESLANELEEKRKKRIDIVGEILKRIHLKRKVFEEIYSPVQIKIESIEALRNSDIKFVSSIVVNERNLLENILSYIDLRLDSKFRGDKGTVFLRDLIESTDFNNYDSVMNLIKIIYSAFDENIDDLDRLLKKREEFNYMIGNLDYLDVKFTINADDKSLNELSPGERGIVLLIFYLALEKENIPLIIDQPEDNLDNQSIYSKLVPAIIEAKKNRQIIIVTHNPNIAVACDSEGVIYCHKNSDDKLLEYVIGSIENIDMNDHIVDVLEGTVPAFNIRRNSYNKIE